MKIQMREVDVKRHTTGYKIGGKWHTRRQAVQLAKKGKIDGVSAYKRAGIDYIQSLPGHRNLYDLATRVVSE